MQYDVIRELHNKPYVVTSSTLRSCLSESMQSINLGASAYFAVFVASVIQIIIVVS